MSDDTLLPSEPSVESTSTESEQAPAQEANFYWQDDMAGEGDAPEWYRGDKYKTVADQAKAYTSLEKRFGAFTGAPESYSLPEEVDSEASYVQMLTEIGQKNNMNQDVFGELLELGESMLSAKMEMDAETELNALGPDGQQRINDVDAYLRNNLGDKYEDLKGAVNNAKVVELVESLVKSTAPTQLPKDSAPAVEQVTQDQIEEMMTRKGPDGQTLYETSEAYREKVYQAMARMNNTDYVPGQHINYG